MGKKSKAEKLEKARQFLQRQTEKKMAMKDQAIRSRYKIPGGVPLLSLEEETLQKIGTSSYVLIFEYYNFDQCGITDISSVHQSKGLINLLDKMSKTAPNHKASIVRDTIERKATNQQRLRAYRSLFSNLPEDIEILHEAEFASEGRVFFFTLEAPSRNFLNVVSIRPLHLPL